MPKYFRAWKAGSAVALAAVAVACGDGGGAAEPKGVDLAVRPGDVRQPSTPIEHEAMRLGKPFIAGQPNGGAAACHSVVAIPTGGGLVYRVLNSSGRAPAVGSELGGSEMKQYGCRTLASAARAEEATPIPQSTLDSPSGDVDVDAGERALARGNVFIYSLPQCTVLAVPSRDGAQRWVLRSPFTAPVSGAIFTDGPQANDWSIPTGCDAPLPKSVEAAPTGACGTAVGRWVFAPEVPASGAPGTTNRCRPESRTPTSYNAADYPPGAVDAKLGADTVRAGTAFAWRLPRCLVVVTPDGPDGYRWVWRNGGYESGVAGAAQPLAGPYENSWGDTEVAGCR